MKLKELGSNESELPAFHGRATLNTGRVGNRWVGGGPYSPVQLQGDTARSGGRPEAALSNMPMASQPPLLGPHSALQKGLWNLKLLP